MTSKEIELILKLNSWTEWYIVKEDQSSELFFCTSADETIIGPFIYVYTDEEGISYYEDVARKTIGEENMKIIKNPYNDGPIVVYMLENTDE